jgi:hypothetical protein
MPARDLMSLPVLLEDVREVAEESVWKVIAPKGVMVLVAPEDEAEALGRLRGMQMVEVELAVGPWLKLKKADGWVRAQGGKRGAARGERALVGSDPCTGDGLVSGAGNPGSGPGLDMRRTCTRMYCRACTAWVDDNVGRPCSWCGLAGP